MMNPNIFLGKETFCRQALEAGAHIFDDVDEYVNVIIIPPTRHHTLANKRDVTTTQTLF